MKRRDLAAAALASTIGGSLRAQGQAAAPQVQLGGVMGSKAMLVVNGQPQMMLVGESRGGIRLVSLQGDQAQVEYGGRVQTLRVGASPVAVGGAPAGGNRGREIVLVAGPGGHFITGGSINGQAVSFLVDTGATTIALSQAEAARIGLDLSNGRRGLTSTANGVVPVIGVTLSSVRVGEVEVINVPAAVIPASMPHVLLGNSFLTRFNMRRENDVMRLERR
ncbi:MAG: TIGR02281 family clan AA aspartic protease [Proteobacteria bacterium]|nr:TIGR02281 family clan AA aspartic protease [Pseudomonadota bacterium]